MFLDATTLISLSSDPSACFVASSKTVIPRGQVLVSIEAQSTLCFHLIDFLVAGSLHFSRRRFARVLIKQEHPLQDLRSAHQRFVTFFARVPPLLDDYKHTSQVVIRTESPLPIEIEDLASDLRTHIYTKLRLMLCQDLLLNDRFTGWKSAQRRRTNFNGTNTSPREASF